MESTFDAAVVNRVVEGLAQSHQKLLLDLEALTDEMVRLPSLLEGWTVGHVLAHITQQGDSIRRIFLAAEQGQIIDQYEGGMSARVAAIEGAALRSAKEHVADVRRSIYDLEGAIASARQGWFGTARMVSGAIASVADLPLRRWREVEVHQGDLGGRPAKGQKPDSRKDAEKRAIGDRVVLHLAQHSRLVRQQCDTGKTKPAIHNSKAD